MANAVILNIPHSSTYIPSDSIHLNGSLAAHGRWAYAQRWKREFPFLVDWFTDELFNNGIGIPIIAPVTRVICDTERFEDDNLEPMAKKGMGVCYTTGHTGYESFPYANGHKEYILENYYRIHHRNLEYAVGRVLSEQKKPVIIDCHSFASVPLPYEPDQTPERPDICIGTDKFHTPETLEKLAKEFFESKGFKVKINSPYSGTIVPLRYYQKDERVRSVMIEVNRSLYMNEITVQKNGQFKAIKETIALFEKEIAEKYAMGEKDNV